ncbi:hypothetical protein A3N65_12395 [Klebsiella aerogenes]|nr:hypothetical protein A3N65_12395 [Klebsiella aerogenes]
MVRKVLIFLLRLRCSLVIQGMRIHYGLNWLVNRIGQWIVNIFIILMSRLYLLQQLIKMQKMSFNLQRSQ